jgi:hypothetical protein
MKVTKRKAPRYLSLTTFRDLRQDTGFYSQIKDLSKIRDSHYLLAKLNVSECDFSYCKLY